MSHENVVGFEVFSKTPNFPCFELYSTGSTTTTLPNSTNLTNLQSCLSADIHVRATCVTSIKFMLHDDREEIDTLLQQYMPAFLDAIKDDDLNVRRVALITFNSAVHNKPHLVSSSLVDVIGWSVLAWMEEKGFWEE